jgi:hypothetical protein
MGLLNGISAQAFTDNFLKTYMAIGEDERAKEATKIAQQMAQAKMKEIADEQAMRAEMSQYQQGLMAPVMGEQQAPVQQMQGQVGQGMMAIQPNPEFNIPTRDTYANQYDAWAAQGKNSEREMLLGQANILSKYNPEKGLAVKASLANTDERTQAQLAIAEAKNKAALDSLATKYEQSIKLLENKQDFQSQLQAKELQNNLDKILLKARTPNVNVNLNGNNRDRTFGVNLRKEYNSLPEIKEGNSIQPKIKAMEAAYAESFKTNNYVAVDQALITLFNKLTDPTSVVRESEYARTAENIPLYNQIKGKVSKVMSGGAGLTTAERNALIKMARDMNRGYTQLRTQRFNEYRGYANQGGVNGDEIINDPYMKGDTPSSSEQRFVIKRVK